MEQVQTYNLLDLAPYIVAIVGTVGMVIAAYIRYKKSPYEAVIVKSEAITNLTDSVDKLTVRLSAEREARLQDCVDFERSLADLRTELSDKYDTRLHEMRVYYEERIKRIEQGHKDPCVESLKTRIKELENKVENGNGG